MALESTFSETSLASPPLESKDPLCGKELQLFKERLERFQKRIGYNFKDENLLVRALTSKSYCSATNGAVPDKGVMESQGDRLLKKSVDLWVRGYYGYVNGNHQRSMRSFLNSNIYLSRVGLQMKIDRCVRISKLKLTAKRSPEAEIRLTANFVESLIEAVYEDGGKKALRAFIEKNILPPPHKGTSTYLVPFMMSLNEENARQAFKLFCYGNASLELKSLGGGKYIGVVHFSYYQKGDTTFRYKAGVRSEIIRNTIFRFLKEYPWLAWGYDGEVSHILPTVIDGK